MTKELHKVISLEDGRVDIADDNGQTVVRKKTKELEAVQLAMLGHILAEERITGIEWEGDSYAVGVPQFVDWNEQTGLLQMEHCEGENLENLLKHAQGEERHRLVNLTTQVVTWMRTSGVLWRDAAPRNILVDMSGRKITLLDFERPLVLKWNQFEDDEFNLLVRGNITEEFSAFLLPDEQEKVFPNVWQDGAQALIDKSSILSGRQIILTERLFGPQDEKVLVQHLAAAQRMMAEVVTPFFVDGEMFFPLLYIEKSPTSQDYIDKVVELYNTPRELWKENLQA